MGTPRRKKGDHARAGRKPTRAARRQPTSPRFVGRDPSPVLDRYPPKPDSRPPAPLATPSAPARAPSDAPAPVPAPRSAVPPPAGSPPDGLIRLERPFDIDEFSQMLGETSIRLTVPRDALAEVLRRATDFMGFGIYVYAITIRPAPSELLKGFVVELQRVDYDAAAGAWKPFVEKGTAGAPGG